MSRGRFAPSPTGSLHLGNARTALLAWLHARAAGGAFVLRMEDLDANRVRDEYRQTQLDDLRWLGIDWDEGPDVGGATGPYVQSSREDRYEAAIAGLRARGLVYPCFCSRREVAMAASAPNGPQDEGPVYPGTCRDLGEEEVERLHVERESSLRFRVPPGDVHFVDLLHGEQVSRPAVETGDFVVQRRDGVAAYQLAVVVDDIAMGITDVVRGADLLGSTARQMLLYDALGYPPPRWLHVPLLLGPGGERMSKRYGDVSLTDLRGQRVSSEEVVGWLAASCGLAEPGERVTPVRLVDRFSVEALPRQPTVAADLPWSRLDGGDDGLPQGGGSTLSPGHDPTEPSS